MFKAQVDHVVKVYREQCRVLKEERDAKAPKNYLANGKVVWTNGTAPTVAPRDGGGQQAPPPNLGPQDDDLPF